MSYRTIAAIAHSPSFRLRLIACAAREGNLAPAEWVQERIWEIAATPEWDAAWASAEAAEIADPGNDEGVITDSMILSRVQALAEPV